MPRQAPLPSQRIHIPDPHLGHVLHLLNAHGLEAISVVPEAPGLVYGVGEAGYADGGQHDEELDYDCREREVVAALGEVVGCWWHGSGGKSRGLVEGDG